MSFLFLEKIIGDDKNKYFYLGLLSFFIVVATVISSSYSRDSFFYHHMFLRFGTSGWEGFGAEIFRREAFFLVVSKTFYMFGFGSIALFIVYSVVSLPVKFHLIVKYSKDRLLSFSFFFSYFFILLDSTQIRFGLAVAFLYLGLHYLSENKKLIFVSIVVFSAIMFHVVSLAFLVMLFFTTKRSMYWLMGMVFISIVSYPLNLGSVMLELVEAVVNYSGFQGTFINKIHFYLLNPSSDVHHGILGRIAVLVYFCAIIIFQYRDKFNAYETLCYSAFILSIFFYILLKDMPDLQVRFGDMFGFSLIFLVPYVHRGLSEYIGVRNAYIILYSFFAVHLVKYTLYDKMLVI